MFHNPQFIVLVIPEMTRQSELCKSLILNFDEEIGDYELLVVVAGSGSLVVRSRTLSLLLFSSLSLLDPDP